MAEPTYADSARELVRRLGMFLADLTRDRPAERIHQEIMRRLQEPEREPDSRVAGIYVLAKDFIAVWTGIRTGAALPASSWETVVLPTVVHYSTTQTVKRHLEAATKMWLSARTALAAPEPEPVGAVTRPGWIAAPVATPDVQPIRDGLPAVLPPVPAEEEEPPASPRRRAIVWIGMLAAFALILVAGLALIFGGGETRRQGAVPGATASLDHQPSPAVPSAGATATPTAATPSPSPGGPTGPGAPRGLVSTGQTATTIALSWQPPAPSGGVEIAYYQVFANGEAAGGRTEGTSHTMVNLAPGTVYRVTVVAFDQHDQPSLPSNAITVRTVSSFSVRPASVPYGNSIKIEGQGWRCQRVNVLLMRAVMPENARYQVASPAPDSAGDFAGTIVVKRDENGEAFVQHLDGLLYLTPGRWRLDAQCGQTSRTATFEVGPRAEDDQRDS